MAAMWGRIRVSEIADVIGGRMVSGAGDTVVQGLSTDTRQMGPGEAFWALKGERFDGHDFVDQAVARGASCVVADRDVSGRLPGKKDTPLLMVADTLRALGDLANWWRKEHAVRVAVITGSVGKTSTKEMAWEILSLRDEPLKNKGNFNNLIGLPLTILGLRPEQRRAVLEMGMNQPGEIARLTEIADPDVGLITRIGRAHLEGVGDLAGVARAKTELLTKISRRSQAILNGDDNLLMETAAPFGREFLTFGLGRDNDVRGHGAEDMGPEGVAFRLRFQGEEAKIRLRVPGQHNIYNALAAAAIALCMGEPLENVVKGLENYRGMPGRFMVTRLENGAVLVDDTYNSNPASLKAAMESVEALAADGGRIIIGLGDMLELGENAREAHLEAGSMVAELGAAYFAALGDYAEDMIRGALDKGFPRERTAVVRDHGEMVDALRERMRGGDLVFLKGSRKVGLDRVAERLKAQ
ncbi:MAG: UDP-N-acetylmuramoyl-tripeptide--D-alanyl-D-alanine ligase [Deltaproteobacteria bacterium]|nr:UDP-N-acetylmuramoyl-tripeptide--D-alanyl-D-alanine ligase [Deltaproteobacteria bacterium]MBW2136577.1 UDP-N-acetylmuramoyl-tripeptide--D-alanyl-D-alanine ligase [Deltaproteobacteria bacterium]